MIMTLDCSHLISLPPLPGKDSGACGKPAVRFPGVSAAAKRLGCTRAHLWAVLAGQRTSHSLTRRYHELKSQSRQP